MKRTICMLLAAVLLLSLAACGSGKTNGGKQTASAYLDQSEDGAAYILITAANKKDMEPIVSRFAFSLTN